MDDIKDTPAPPRRIVAVLTRAIPVEGAMTDVLTRVVDPDVSMESLMAWAESRCAGPCPMVRLEITREDL